MEAVILKLRFDRRRRYLLLIAQMDIVGRTYERQIAVGPFPSAMDRLRWQSDFKKTECRARCIFAEVLYEPGALPHGLDAVRPNTIFGQPTILAGDLSLIIATRGTSPRPMTVWNGR
jgi:hypothetical protein